MNQIIDQTLGIIIWLLLWVLFIIIDKYFRLGGVFAAVFAGTIICVIIAVILTMKEDDQKISLASFIKTIKTIR